MQVSKVAVSNQISAQKTSFCANQYALPEKLFGPAVRAAEDLRHAELAKRYPITPVRCTGEDVLREIRAAAANFSKQLIGGIDIKPKKNYYQLEIKLPEQQVAEAKKISVAA